MPCSARHRPPPARYVLPNQTDPALTNFNDAHFVALPADPGQRLGKLLLHLPGSGHEPWQATNWVRTAAVLGYHAISIKYRNVPSIASFCGGNTNLNCYRLMTGRTDAQGCELGSDDQIRERLMSGPCFGDWEGTIVLSRVESVMGTTQNGARTGTWDNGTRELYSATVKRVVRHRTFTSGGKPAESWELETDGVYHAGVRIKRQLVDDPPNWEVVTTTTDTASAAESFPASGDIHLRLVDGRLESLGAGGGPAESPLLRGHGDLLPVQGSVSAKQLLSHRQFLEPKPVPQPVPGLRRGCHRSCGSIHVGPRPDHSQLVSGQGI